MLYQRSYTETHPANLLEPIILTELLHCTGGRYAILFDRFDHIIGYRPIVVGETKIIVRTEVNCLDFVAGESRQRTLVSVVAQGILT